MLEVLKNRLVSKEKELEYQKNSFKILVETEIDRSSNFANNAINALLYIKKITHEIEELKFTIEMMELNK